MPRCPTDSQQLRALQEENQFLATQLKRCKAGKPPKPSAAFQKRTAKVEAKLTKLARNVAVLKEEIRKVQVGAKTRFKSLRFDQASLEQKRAKITEAVEVRGVGWGGSRLVFGFCGVGHCEETFRAFAHLHI